MKCGKCGKECEGHTLISEDGDRDLYSRCCDELIEKDIVIKKATIETVEKGTNCIGCLFIKYCRWGDQINLMNILEEYLGLPACLDEDKNIMYKKIESLESNK